MSSLTVQTTIDFYIVARRQIYCRYPIGGAGFADTATRDGYFNVQIHEPDSEPEEFFKTHTSLILNNRRAAVIIFMNGMTNGDYFKAVQAYVDQEYSKVVATEPARKSESRIILFLREEPKSPASGAHFIEQMEAALSEPIREGFAIASAYPRTIDQAFFRVLDSI